MISIWAVDFEQGIGVATPCTWAQGESQSASHPPPACLPTTWQMLGHLPNLHLNDVTVLDEQRLQGCREAIGSSGACFKWSFSQLSVVVAKPCDVQGWQTVKNHEYLKDSESLLNLIHLICVFSWTLHSNKRPRVGHGGWGKLFYFAIAKHPDWW